MSDLFMNMQRRHRWHEDSQQKQHSRTGHKRSTRAATPGPQTLGNQTQIHEIPQINETQPQCEDKSNQNDSTADEDPLANILSLQLRKPKHWKWELTTSKSCSNIALPRIILYDHKGNLLVDAPPGDSGTLEHVYKQNHFEVNGTSDKTKKRPYSHQRSVTTNLTHSVRKALEKEFDGLQIQEVDSDSQLCNTPSASSTLTTTTMRSPRSRKHIDFNTKDLSDISRRSSSARGVRFHVDDENEAKIPDLLPTPPSTTTPTSSSSGPREKRKYRRSHSSHSGRSSSTRSQSILERFSYQKGRFSSPETEEERLEDGKQSSRYSLRTDEAGTLLVHENSSSSSQNPRRRRKLHKLQTSSESINKTQESLNHNDFIQSSTIQETLNTPKTPNSDASSRPSSRERRRKLQPKFYSRHRTEGDILANKTLSTSEEDNATEKEAKANIIPSCPTLGVGCSCHRQRKYTRNETRDLNASISPLGVQRNGKVR